MKKTSFSRGLVIVVLTLALVVAVLLRCGESAETFSYLTYCLYIGDSVTIAWDADPSVDHYEVQAKHFEQNQIVKNTLWQSIKTNSLTVTIPRGGHWEWQVRACSLAECSAWSESVKPENALDGKPWWIYSYIAPPSQGGIGD